MRLFNICTGKVEEPKEGEIPDYIAITHVWDKDDTEHINDESELKECKKYKYLINNIKQVWIYTPDKNQGNDDKEELIKRKKYLYLKSCIEKDYKPIKHVWIDTLCIIQNDDEDKVKEIPHMTKYYKGAKCTFIIFPEDIYDSVKKIESIWNENVSISGPRSILRETLLKYDESEPFIKDVHRKWDEDTDFKKAVCRFAFSKWFERTWTFQEMVLCKNGLITIKEGEGIIDVEKSIGIIAIIDLKWSKEVNLHYAEQYEGVKSEWKGSKNPIKYLTRQIRMSLFSMLFYGEEKHPRTVATALAGVWIRKHTRREDSIFGVLGYLDYNIDVEYSEVLFQEEYNTDSREAWIYHPDLDHIERSRVYQKIYDKLVDVAITRGDDFFLYIQAPYKTGKSDQYKPIVTHRLCKPSITGNFGIVKNIHVNEKEGLKIEIESEYDVISYRLLTMPTENYYIKFNRRDYGNVVEIIKKMIVNYKGPEDLKEKKIIESLWWCVNTKLFDEEPQTENIEEALYNWLVDDITSSAHNVYIALIKDNHNNNDVCAAFLFGEMRKSMKVYVTKKKGETYRLYHNGTEGVHYGVLVESIEGKCYKIGHSVSSKLEFKPCKIDEKGNEEECIITLNFNNNIRKEVYKHKDKTEQGIVEKFMDYFDIDIDKNFGGIINNSNKLISKLKLEGNHDKKEEVENLQMSLTRYFRVLHRNFLEHDVTQHVKGYNEMLILRSNMVSATHQIISQYTERLVCILNEERDSEDINTDIRWLKIDADKLVDHIKKFGTVIEYNSKILNDSIEKMLAWTIAVCTTFNIYNELYINKLNKLYKKDILS